MKKAKPSKQSMTAMLFAATAIAGVATVRPAHANVTIYPGNGPIPSIVAYIRIDAGLKFDTNVDLSEYNGKTGTSTITQAGGNDWGTSMFGVTGESQLTPDLKGIYKVESGFNTTTGGFNGGKGSIFNRRAYVGLSNDEFGTIMFGKDLFIDNDVWNFDPMVQENMSTSTLVYGRNWLGASDMVEYRSPNWSGLQIGLMGSFNNGDTVATTHISNAYGISGEYDLGNLSMYGIYDEMQDNNGNYTNLYSASREAIFGITYDLKPVKLYGGYEILNAPDGSKAKGGTPIVNPGASYNPYPAVYATHAYMSWLGAVWTVSPKVTLRGAWFHTGINDSGGNASLFTAGMEYYLSPNLFLYATGGEVVNSGKANFSADIYSPPPAPGRNQFTGYFGASISF